MVFKINSFYKLVLLHTFIIALSNYLVQFPFNFFGVLVTWGMFTFPFLVLATDLTVRILGKSTARKVVFLAYIPCVLISISLNSFRVGFASGLAYLFGQLLDIFLFQKVRQKSKKWWSAPLLSTSFSNIFDTYIFFFMSFYNCNNEFLRENWLQIAHADLIFKLVLSTIFFLPLYGFLLKIILGVDKVSSKKVVIS